MGFANGLICFMCHIVVEFYHNKVPNSKVIERQVMEGVHQ
jgi:hypothetical protein